MEEVGERKVSEVSSGVFGGAKRKKSQRSSISGKKATVCVNGEPTLTPGLKQESPMPGAISVEKEQRTSVSQKECQGHRLRLKIVP